MWTPEAGDWRQARGPGSYSALRAGEWLDVKHGSAQWHALRRTHVTATQIRDTLGLGYAGCSLASVYAYRRGGAIDGGEWLLALGRAAEPALLQWWSDREGVPIATGSPRVADGVMASMDAWTGDLAPVESKLRQPWGDDPYADGGCTPGEVCQLQVQCWVLGAPAGILVAARGAEVHTRWVRHPEGAALREIEAAVEAIRRADREGWPAVADWLLARGQWDPYRAQGQAAEPRYAPELADAAEDLAECERLLSSARSEVRALERRRATVYCRLSEGGESEIDTGGHVVAPVYRAGRLSGWKVEA